MRQNSPVLVTEGPQPTDGKYYRASLRNSLAHQELGPPYVLNQITLHRKHSQVFIPFGVCREEMLWRSLPNSGEIEMY